MSRDLRKDIIAAQAKRQKPRTPAEQEAAVAALAARYAAGQDLWSGKPLEGDTRSAWERHKAEEARQVHNPRKRENRVHSLTANEVLPAVMEDELTLI